MLIEMSDNNVKVILRRFLEKIPLELLLVFEAFNVRSLDKRDLHMLCTAVLRNHGTIHRGKNLRVSYQEKDKEREVVFGQGLQF